MYKIIHRNVLFAAKLTQCVVSIVVHNTHPAQSKITNTTFYRADDVIV